MEDYPVYAKCCHPQKIKSLLTYLLGSFAKIIPLFSFQCLFKCLRTFLTPS